MKKAVVSLAVGERCHQPWQRFLRPSWQLWCSQHGYELIVFTEPLDHSEIAANRSVAWQKLLAMASPQLSTYDAAIWIDADILLCPWAPDPWVDHPPDRIGMALDSGSPRSKEPGWFQECFSEILARSLSESGRSTGHGFSYMQLWGFDPTRRPLFNSGVITYAPQRHAPLLKEIYYNWHDGGPGALYEMIPLNLVTQQLGICHELDFRYNRLFGVYYAVWMKLCSEVPSLAESANNTQRAHRLAKHLAESSYFLHFAGVHSTMQAILNQGDLTR